MYVTALPLVVVGTQHVPSHYNCSLVGQWVPTATRGRAPHIHNLVPITVCMLENSWYRNLLLRGDRLGIYEFMYGSVVVTSFHGPSMWIITFAILGTMVHLVLVENLHWVKNNNPFHLQRVT